VDKDGLPDTHAAVSHLAFPCLDEAHLRCSDTFKRLNVCYEVDLRRCQHGLEVYLGESDGWSGA
jgi:hypothetical protein